jgi:hypothetical protein
VSGMMSRFKSVRRRMHYARQIVGKLGGVHPRECNICGYSGLFAASGLPPRFDAQCPSCKSLERHRHQYLWLKEHEGDLRGKRILHFAPEPVMRKIYSGLAATYLSADIAGYADRILNIEAIDLPDESWDVVVATMAPTRPSGSRSPASRSRPSQRPSPTSIFTRPRAAAASTLRISASRLRPAARRSPAGASTCPSAASACGSR